MPTRANGQPAFGLYVRDPQAPIAHAIGILVLTLAGSQISAVTGFLEQQRAANVRALPHTARLNPPRRTPAGAVTDRGRWRRLGQDVAGDIEPGGRRSAAAWLARRCSASLTGVAMPVLAARAGRSSAVRNEPGSTGVPGSATATTSRRPGEPGDGAEEVHLVRRGPRRTSAEVAWASGRVKDDGALGGGALAQLGSRGGGVVVQGRARAARTAPRSRCPGC